MLLDFLYYENLELEQVRRAIEAKRMHEYRKVEKREKVLSLRKQANETLNKMEKAASVIKTVVEV